jgi:hypothetical protein
MLVVDVLGEMIVLCAAFFTFVVLTDYIFLCGALAWLLICFFVMLQDRFARELPLLQRVLHLLRASQVKGVSLILSWRVLLSSTALIFSLAYACYL